jgi:hypothetical protein
LRLGARAIRGAEARIVRCRTQPTASIPRRVQVLREQVVRRGGLQADELHFVGHSTGGLDVRMLLTPGVKIARGDVEERIARRTRSATSVATPHHGTPLANHFLTLQGQMLLLVLSGLATSGPGRGTVLAAARAIAVAARLDDWLRGSGGRTADWLPSGAGFMPEGFDATWDAVAGAIAASGRAARALGGPDARVV